MTLEAFLEKLGENPSSIEFDDTLEMISCYYDYTPTAFRNGEQENQAGENEGSCKILAFGQLHDLTVEQTLHCFGHHYRDDVLARPDAESHQNIRQFMQHGWEGVVFTGKALTRKAT